MIQSHGLSQVAHSLRLIDKFLRPRQMGVVGNPSNSSILEVAIAFMTWANVTTISLPVLSYSQTSLESTWKVTQRSCLSQLELLSGDTVKG